MHIGAQNILAIAMCWAARVDASMGRSWAEHMTTDTEEALQASGMPVL